jgi:hypothetical protein
MAKTPQQLLAEYQKKISALQAQIDRKNRVLLALPKKYGFTSMEALIAALRAAQNSVKPAKTTESGRRAKITAEMKAKVKDLVKAGKTGAEIAKALGISLPSVQNIKKELGLVKKRK